MPILDTPITTDDTGLERILAQPQPVLILLHDGTLDKPLEDAAKKSAKKHAGDLLIARVDVHNSPETHAQYSTLGLPALVTMTEQKPIRQVKSQAEYIRPSDLRTHIDHLLKDKPLPQAASIGEQIQQKSTPKPVKVSDKTFDKEVLKSDVPVLVDFWAAWCGPCQMIAPYVEQLAKEYQGRVKIAKLDTDHNQSTARRFQIQSIPTFIVFKNGQPVDRLSGANPPAIKNMIEEAL